MRYTIRSLRRAAGSTEGGDKMRERCPACGFRTVTVEVRLPNGRALRRCARCARAYTSIDPDSVIVRL